MVAACVEFRAYPTAPNRRPHEYWGLGDLIRGALFTAIICARLGVECRWNFRYHPIGTLLQHSDEPTEVPADQPTFFHDYRTLERDIRATSSTQVRVLVTNGDPATWNWSIPEELRARVRALLNLPAQPSRTVAHFRLGDRSLVRGFRVNAGILNSCLAQLRQLPKGTLLLTDCNELRMLARREGFPVSTVTPTHSSCSTNLDDLRGVLSDLATLTSADVIWYRIPSGFISLASICYHRTAKRLP